MTRPLRSLALVAAGLAAYAPAASALAGGDLDPTYGTAGVVELDLARGTNGYSYVSDLARLSDGRILAASIATGVDDRPAALVTGLTEAGRRDATLLGGGGSAQLGFGPTPSMGLAGLARDDVSGAVTIFGWGADATTPGSSRPTPAAARLNGDGSPDLGFAGTGVRRVEILPAPAHAFVNGGARGGDGSTYLTGTLEVNPSTGALRNLFVIKLDANGVPDPGFGTGGIVKLNVAVDIPPAVPSGTGGSYGGAIRVLDDGRVVVAGTATDASTRQSVLIMRLLRNGGLDPSFGVGGSGYRIHRAADPADVSGHDSQGSDLAIDGEGRIYVAGGADDAEGSFALAVTRFGSSGVVDNAFGSGGTVRLQLSTDPANRYSYGTKVLLQSNGKVVVAGSARTSGGETQGVVVRLSGDGKLDPSFGVNGIERLDVVPGGSERSGIGDALLTREGLLYLGGSITRGSDSTGFVARMVVNVPPTAVIARPSRPLAGRPIALDASGSTDRDGRIVATRWTVDGVAQAATTVRLTAGSHRIGLTATDDEGARGTASLVIGVASGRLALAGKQRAYAVAKDGTVRLRAACAAPGRCEGVASLTRGKGSARRTYATAAYGVAPGKRRVVVLRVTKAGRKLLRKGPLRFRVAFAPPAGGGPTSVGTVKLTLAP